MTVVLRNSTHDAANKNWSKRRITGKRAPTENIYDEIEIEGCRETAYSTLKKTFFFMIASGGRYDESGTAGRGGDKNRVILIRAKEETTAGYCREPRAAYKKYARRADDDDYEYFRGSFADACLCMVPRRFGPATLTSRTVAEHSKFEPSRTR